VTDPPYKVTARGNAGNSGGMMQDKLSMQGKIFKHNDIRLHSITF
jgi:site-specific DNA-methyltransferase (adenine-specific)